MRLSPKRSATNKVEPCVLSVQGIDGPTFFPLHKFPIGEQVTYNYFTGRLALYDGDYAKAAERLGFAFGHCVRDSRNKSE